MQITAFQLAQRFVGIKEIAGSINHPQIMAMLKLDVSWPSNDEVSWCSAFTNYICWLLRLPRTKSLWARSWLTIGKPIIDFREAKAEYDIVILTRGKDPQPGADIISAPGHVGFFAGLEITKPIADKIYVLGGNQNDEVSVKSFPTSQILGIRRLYESS